MRRICDLLREGHTIATVCEGLGVGERTYFDWGTKHPHFLQETTCARANGKIALVRQILADKDWRAKAWYLEGCWPTEFGRTVERELPPLAPPADEKKKVSIAVVDTGGRKLEEVANFPVIDRSRENEVPDPESASSKLFDSTVENVETDGEAANELNP